MGNRTPTGSRNASRESSRNRKSTVSIEREREQVPAAKEISEELMQKKSTSILQEFISGGELNVSGFYQMLCVCVCV